MITIPAYAKINLTFEVLGKRDDGYHDIASVLQTIDLSDIVSFEPAPDMSFSCCDPGLSQVALLREACLGAANFFIGETGCKKGAHIRIESAGIPRAVGLGASSSLPAVVVRGLNELWELGLSLEQMSQIASLIGSDTPFFIYGGLALARGRGELITPLPSLFQAWFVLLDPGIDPVPDKTARMYGMLSHVHFTNGDRTKKFIGDLQQGCPLQSLAIYNTFESVAFDFFPELENYYWMFCSTGADKVHLAGAGPMLFTQVSDETNGMELVGRLQSLGMIARLVRTI